MPLPGFTHRELPLVTRPNAWRRLRALLPRSRGRAHAAAWHDAALQALSTRRHGTRAVLLAAAVILLLVWLAIAGVLTRSRASTIEAEQRVLQRMTSVVEEQSRHLFSLLEFFLVGTEAIFEAHPDEDPRTNGEFLTLVNNLRSKTQGGIAVQLMAADGSLYAVPRLDDRAVDLDTSNHVPPPSTLPARAVHIGRPVRHAATGQWHIPVAYPLASASHGITAVVADLESRVLGELYDLGRTRPEGSIALVRRDGTLLARAPGGEQLVGRSIATGPIWRDHLPASDQGVAVLPATVIDSTARMVAYAALLDFPLVVIVSSRMDDVLAAWRQRLVGAVLAGLALSLLVVAGARHLAFLLAELSKAHAEVRQQALRDALTGLPNRRMFLDRLAQEIGRADRSGLAMALLFIDLDLFKEVNDTLGHDAGDLLLEQAAARLRSCVRGTDTVARLGGDEFTLILPGERAPAGVERVVHDILDSLSQPFVLKGEQAYISASVGITMYPQDARSVEDLIKNADQAMYAAKASGRNRWKYFTPAMQSAAQSRMRLIHDARVALLEGQFRLHYQPIVDLASGAVHKAEALVRWQHPERGVIAPADFIPTLEETELIVALGDWVFREAAQQAARWRATLHPAFQISVNKSPAQFKHRAHSLQGWREHLRELGQPGQAIAVEITEGLILDASEVVAAKLLELVQAGMQISLDDFGTGYSSLSYLKKFDIDFIKIDRSFVANLEHNAGDVALCEGIIAMAHKLGVKVIAEGVETSRQRELLAAMSCDYAQGFLFSRPVAARDFARLVQGLSAGPR